MYRYFSEIGKELFMNNEIMAFICYFILMLGIGLYFYVKDRKTETETGSDDYFLGGRKMGPWVTAMSAQASDMSAWLLMGLPGAIMAFGLGQAWIGVGLVIGTTLNWILVAKRLRKFSKAAGDSITLPQYLQNRFVTKNPTVTILCAVVFLISFTIYVASGFVAGATVFTTLVPELPTDKAMIIFAVVILLYTFLGGFKAVCWTDFFQGFLMLFALIAVTIMMAVSGHADHAALSQVYTNVHDGTRYAFTSNMFNASWQEVVSGLTWGLGYFGMPHILVRFMSIEKPSMIKKSTVVALTWVVISLFCSIAIAYLGRMIFGAELLPEGLQKTVFIVAGRKYFPSFLSGILMAAIIAASMSTADSQLLVASSSFTEDIYKKVIRKDASEKELLWIGRLVVVIVSVVAYFIASSKGAGAQAIMDMVENAWGLFGAAFGPVVLLSLFWKRYNQQGAIAGIIAGAVVDIVWLKMFAASTGLYELFPGFIAALAASVIVTLLTPAPSAEVERLFDYATDPENDN